MSACLSDDTVLAFVVGALSPDEIEVAESHLATCRDCRALVAEAARADGSTRPAGRNPEWPPALGSGIGRYLLVAPIGAGANGIVYRAYDPRLKREVALKLLPPPAAGAPTDVEERLLAEAEALARLSHPNVVAVFDAGFDGCVYIAIELVTGQTLAAWRQAQSRSWREIAQVFAAAADGLAAAHAAGLVHRDFKPENLLVDGAGRVKVTDFGMARPVHAAGDEGPAGTPLYMAPELFDGGTADERSDQFAFCAALFEALHDVHPFADPAAVEPLQALAEATIAGRIRPIPTDGGEPAALRALVVRGLSSRPGDRHPSMTAIAEGLRSALTASPTRRLGRVSLVAGAFVALVAAFFMVRGRGGAPALVCGNGQLDRGEECDDGNRIDTDGCTGSCLQCTGGDAAFGWSENGHCYRRFDKPASWAEARAACADVRGDLATFTAIYEVRAVVDPLLRESASPIWIGLQGDERTNNFSWVTGEPLVITAWAPGEPKPAGTCVQQFAGKAQRLTGLGIAWMTSPCQGSASFLCETVPWTVRQGAGHAYKVFTVPLAWPAARDACLRNAGHLATLADAEEEAFVSTLVGTRVWIGACDADKEGTFAWVTNEAFSFRRFGPKEPDDHDGTDDCVALGPDPVWHDRTCGEANAYVCEIE